MAFIVILRSGWNWAQKLIFWLILRDFCSCCLMPYDLCSKFLANEDLIKIHNHDQFHQYSICGCQVIIFQSFSYWFSIHKVALFGFFMGPYSPKCGLIMLQFSPEVFKNSALRIFQKISFWLKWDIPKIYKFGPIWGAIYPWKTKNIAEKQNFCKNCILKTIK